MKSGFAVAPWYSDTMAVVATLARRNGDMTESHLLERALRAGDAHVDAQFHLLCGDVDQGGDWTEKAIEERDQSRFAYLRFVVCKELRASRYWPKIAKMLVLAEERGLRTPAPGLAFRQAVTPVRPLRVDRAHSIPERADVRSVVDAVGVASPSVAGR